MSRSAQDLGLHRKNLVVQAPGEDISDFLPRLWFDEYKRRLWVTVFIWDAHMALMLGRVRMINASDCTVMVPTDCDIPLDLTTRIPMPPSSAPWSSPYTAQIFHYTISHKIHEMLSSSAGNVDAQSHQKVQMLDNEVRFRIMNLPEALQPHVQNTVWDTGHPDLPQQRLQNGVIANSFLMALHRPYANTQVTSRDAGIEAALETLDLQQRQFGWLKKHQYRIYGFSFFTINAGIFLSAVTLERPPEQAEFAGRIYQALEQAIARLAAMKEQNAMGKSGVEILSQCYRTIIASPVKKSPPQQAFDYSIPVSHFPLMPTMAANPYPAEQDLAPELLSHGLDFSATMLESMGLIPELLVDPSLENTDWFNYTGPM